MKKELRCKNPLGFHGDLSVSLSLTFIGCRVWVLFTEVGSDSYLWHVEEPETANSVTCSNLGTIH